MSSKLCPRSIITHGRSFSAGTQGVREESEHSAVASELPRISLKSKPPAATTFVGTASVKLVVGGSGGGGGWGGRINRASKRCASVDEHTRHNGAYENLSRKCVYGDE